MKLLVFAHKPPPHHGQSYMVQLLLDQLGGDDRARSGLQPPPPIRCYHVDARFSDGIQDIGRPRLGKVFQLIRYCWQAIGCRVRHGVRAMLYVPAPPAMRAALYRDWIIMAACRPFFPIRVYYWQAAGLAEWLRTQAKPWERWTSRLLLHHPQLSIVLGEFNRGDGDELGSRQVAFVPNAVPDPCPNFDTDLLPQRQARARARRERLASTTTAAESTPAPAGGEAPAPLRFRVLYLSLCLREKGLFDAIDAVVLLNKSPRLQAAGIRLELTVCGGFWVEAEKTEFEGRVQRECFPDGTPMVEYRGFVSGPAKEAAFRESDVFCFPSYYAAESFPVALVEAMAFGLPAVVTRWRMLPELLPANHPTLVDLRAPDQIVRALERCLEEDYDPTLRRHFLARYTAERFREKLIEVLGGLEQAH